MNVNQALSELYTIQVQIKTKDSSLSFQDFLYKDAEIVLKCGEKLDADRKFTGIVTRFVQGTTRFGDLDSTTKKFYTYDVEIRPKLWVTTQRYGSKVFQKKTAKDIISEVLGDAGVSFKWSIKGTPPEREYCLQYEETDFEFVSRLLEDEGITYFFDHDAKQVVFANDPSGHPGCKPDAKAQYSEEKSNWMFFGKDERVQEFSYEEIIGTGKFTSNDYNYETAQTKIKADDTEGGVPCFPKLEIYEHTLNYPDAGAGKKISTLRKEEMVCRSKRARGRTTCRSFETGYSFTLSEHFRGDMNRKWILASCAISMEQGLYQCQFTAIPADIAFRPMRKTPRPKVTGVQTAVVTGPGGSKVYLDDMGRAKIQFHWDRDGQMNDRSSMWVRVSNGYAGKDYGIQWIPRVGHEVLVSFINGDPDRPLITGRVYNDFNSCPLKPANKWQNIIKTIKDNHILFDDEDGKELIHIRAHKDMETLVVNNETLTVGNDRKISVEKYHSESVGKDMTIKVGDNLKENVGANYQESVGGNYQISVNKNMTTTVTKNTTLNVRKSLTEDITDNINISSGKNYTLDVGKKANFMVGKTTVFQGDDNITIKGKKKMVIDVKDQLTLKVGRAKLIMKKNGDVSINGKKFNLKCSSNIKNKGSKIALN
ncbi:type VI secretion system tip protein VgrG [Sulfidibacter corallicola]|uniref:Type VI secretion system tip protein VgrG n=2 Tax=Sulfidibacter corallicola TaxID=2818388 RepID=A0A8A4TY75_SULCO|nr:type VI secretion system tip protein VgrG [Sulfidibacter corallicola]